ncbi:MAG: hypothetical protein V1487_03520 [bacterium]
MPKSNFWSKKRRFTPAWLVSIIAFLVITSLFLYHSLNAPVNINEISYPQLIPTCNKNKLRSLALSNPCDRSSFTVATYRCDANGFEGSLDGCRTLADWQQQAESRCPEVCVAPSPLPTTKPTPLPSGCITKSYACPPPSCPPFGGPCAIADCPPSVTICPSPSPTFLPTPPPDTPVSSITPSELKRGWYYGSKNQKKTGTPIYWSFQDAGRSSCWHAPFIKCQ